jgi:hypothetical protein
VERLEREAKRARRDRAENAKRAAEKRARQLQQVRWPVCTAFEPALDAQAQGCCARSAV